MTLGERYGKIERRGGKVIQRRRAWLRSLISSSDDFIVVHSIW